MKGITKQFSTGVGAMLMVSCITIIEIDERRFMELIHLKRKRTGVK